MHTRHQKPRPKRNLFSEHDRNTFGIEPVITAAKFHENAYMAGRGDAIRILEVVVGLQKSQRFFRNGLRYEADREYVRGLLDALMPMMSDTASFLRDRLKLEREFRDCVSDDFFDCSASWLRTLQEQQPYYNPSEAHR
jgi:hypothetical protein